MSNFEFLVCYPCHFIVTEVVAFMEKCREFFQSKERPCMNLQAAIPSLNANLKVYGQQLELNYKGVLF